MLIDIVGGGPVGLALACLLVRQWQYKVRVFEKRTHYTRTHYVYLTRLSFLPEISHRKMRLNELENRLKQLAESLGVQFIHQNVIDLTGLT
jgi:2-polyprenyl-6-methoxyphenol hydroxylase-like FAD-dependent oxidoreductase